MSVRSRLQTAARAWLACLALQFAAVPVAEAAARPTVTVCAAAAAAEAPSRRAARTAVRSEPPFTPLLRVRAAAAPPARTLPAPAARAPRVLIPRLYLRLLSIRR